MKRLRNERGNILLVMLGTLTVVAILALTFAQNVSTLSKESVRMTDTILYKIAMRSLVDYTKAGLKRRWCFSDVWTQDNNCTLAHPRSTERLLFSEQQVQYVRELIEAHPATPHGNPLALNTFQAEIPVAGMTPQHPLYEIAQSLFRLKVKAIRIKLTRENGLAIPTKGREAAVSIAVSLISDSGLFFGNKPTYEAKAQVILFPREVGSYALVVANDLYLDRSTPPDKGDAAIPPRVGVPSNVYAGLRFESPVFVNGSIHLPKARSSASKIYTPVTFGETVVLGGGLLKRDNKYESPVTAGGEGDRYYSEYKEFGGFLRGLLIDGDRDIGLDYLSGRLTGSIPDRSLMQKCIGRTLAQSNLNLTDDSSLLVKQEGNRFRLAWNRQNFFREQNRLQIGANWYGNFYSRPTVKGDGNPVMRVDVDLGGPKAAAWMSRNSTLTLQPRIGALPDQDGIRRASLEIASLTAALADKSSDLASTRAKLADIKNQDSQSGQGSGSSGSSGGSNSGSGTQPDTNSNTPASSSGQSNNSSSGALNTQSNELQTNSQGSGSSSGNSGGSGWGERADSIRESLSIGYLEYKIRSLENDIKDLVRRLEAAKAAEAKARADYASANQQASNPPTVTIKNVPVMYDGLAQENQSMFSVDFSNAESFTNSIRVKLTAFDVSTENGNLLRRWRNGSRFLNFLTLDYQGADPKSGLMYPSLLNSYTPHYMRADRQPVTKDDLEFEVDYSNTNQACAKMSENGNAFAPSDWDVSFAKSSRNSWNFNPVENTLEITSASSSKTEPSFLVHSIAPVCRITSSAEFVTGFFTCDHLIIEARTTPLRIIGTFIVNRMTVAPQALDAGIHWSSIYEPAAVRELQKVGVLKSLGPTCEYDENNPIWHPNPSLKRLSDLYHCNSISLRAKADPFQWTTVDPDCGLMPGSASHVCKKRANKFLVKEVSMEMGQ